VFAAGDQLYWALGNMALSDNPYLTDQQADNLAYYQHLLYQAQQNGDAAGYAALLGTAAA
jgi:hypothetical protein